MGGGKWDALKAWEGTVEDIWVGGGARYENSSNHRSWILDLGMTMALTPPRW